MWERRRSVSGHGALDRNDRPLNEPLIVMVAGPIVHWWGENWMSPEHRRYDAWRAKVCDALVQWGYLIYMPHQAIKGTWTPRAQQINDAAIGVSDVVLVLTPEGVPAEGTADEEQEAEKQGKTVIHFPPPADKNADRAEIGRLLHWLGTLTDLMQPERGRGLARNLSDTPAEDWAEYVASRSGLRVPDPPA